MVPMNLCVSSSVLHQLPVFWRSSCEEARNPDVLAKLVEKLQAARHDGGVVITTPDAIKSVMLKFVDSLESASVLEAQAQRGSAFWTPDEKRAVDQRQAVKLVRNVSAVRTLC